LIEDRRQQCGGAVESGAVESAYVIALESRAAGNIGKTTFGGQSAFGRYSPKHNPG
jgi:hypothetical protein